MKFCVFVIFQLCPWIIRVGDWALRWTEGNQTLQIFFVMLFFPVVMNALQYYIIDGFIKDQKPADHDPIPSDDGHDEDDDSSPDEIEAAEDGVEESALMKGRNDDRSKEEKDKEANAKVASTNLDEYDPALDGTSSNSSSRGSERDDSQRPRAAAHQTNSRQARQPE